LTLLFLFIYYGDLNQNVKKIINKNFSKIFIFGQAKRGVRTYYSINIRSLKNYLKKKKRFTPRQTSLSKLIINGGLRRSTEGGMLSFCVLAQKP
jgi:hypothetical protein